MKTGIMGLLSKVSFASFSCNTAGGLGWAKHVKV